VGKYRLSRLARDQIRDIDRHTLKQFGQYQAKAYHQGLERTFGLLADFPKMGAEVAEILPGLRRFRFQSHIVFYSEAPYGVLIRAVLHAAQNIRRELFE